MKRKNKSNQPEIAVSVSGLSKTFRPQPSSWSLKTTLLSLVASGWTKKPSATVLKNINFNIPKGQFFAIIGRNGSGKSTLLKLLAGIYQPNEGSIKVTGKIVSLIELGAGLQPELSGRDNVYLGAALVGLSQKQTDEIYDSVVAFAQLEKDMDKQLKNYSSGMQVRLAFSIMAHIGGDVFLVDEVLAVGDDAFQAKCLKHLEGLKRQAKTVVLVSHDLDSLKKFCQQGILLENKEVSKQGSLPEIIKAYKKLFENEFIA